MGCHYLCWIKRLFTNDKQILANTYTIYSQRGLALYHDGIIEAIPHYKKDKVYGSLISMCPPMNVIATLFLPFFLLIKDEKKLIKLNNFLLFIGYLPVLIGLTIGFIGINCLLIPFAYLYALIGKIGKLF